MSNPATPTLTNVTGECTATASVPSTTDNCSWNNNWNNFGSFNVFSTQGTHTINWTFDDGNGNVISVPQNVVIN